MTLSALLLLSVDSGVAVNGWSVVCVEVKAAAECAKILFSNTYVLESSSAWSWWHSRQINFVCRRPPNQLTFTCGTANISQLIEEFLIHFFDMNSNAWQRKWCHVRVTSGDYINHCKFVSIFFRYCKLYRRCTNQFISLSVSVCDKFQGWGNIEVNLYGLRIYMYK